MTKGYNKKSIYETSNRNMNHFPDTANPMKSEVGKQHNFTTAQSIGVLGGAIMTEQLKGGEELRDSSALAGMALHPFVETISAGKNNLVFLFCVFNLQ